MQPGTLNLTVTQGDDGTWTLTFTDPADLTGYTITAQARPDAGSATFVDFTIDAADAATGIIVIGLAAADTAGMSPGRWAWDLQWVDPGGDVLTVLADWLIVRAEVTR